MPNIEYELLLDSQQQDRTRAKIENTFNTTLTPITEGVKAVNKKSEVTNCYIANLDVDDDDQWGMAFAISQLKGVRDVEPNLFVPEVRERRETSTSCFPKPAHFLGWNKKKTKFKEAEDYAIQQGRTAGGKGVRIGQLDTGYTDHPELKNILKKDGYDVYKDDLDPRDELDDGFLLQPSHGTSTGSVITAFEKKLPDGDILGLAPQADFIPFRISPSVIHVFRQKILKGVLRALEEKCQVISLSMGGAPPRKFWELAATEAYEKGAIWVCAAGNIVDWVVWPARYPQTICVAATDFEDVPWDDTSEGKTVDISAPGHKIYVARTRQDNTFCYKNGSGTSYATPHVAAAAAVWLAFHGKDLNQYMLPWQKVEAFRHCLKRSARTPNGWNKKLYGAGILDVEKLLKVKLPKKETLNKRIFPIKYNRPESTSVNMVHREIMYLTLSAEHKKQLSPDYIVSKSSKRAKAMLDKQLSKKEMKNKSDKKKVEMLKRAFLIGF